MTDLPVVDLPPINGRLVRVGLVSEDYNIGGSRKGKNLVQVYDNRTLDYIAEMAKKRINHRFDCRIVVSGPVRTGKSTIAVSLARALDPTFTPDRVAFRLEDFTKILAALPPADPEKGFYPCAIYDEAGTGLYSKDFQMRLVKQMSKIFQVIGKKNLTMIMCLPHRNLLTKDIREQMHIWVSTRTDLDGERGFAELREAIENIWQLEVFWKPLCGFCFDEVDDDFWKAYEIFKDAFIDEFVLASPEEKPGRFSVKNQRLTDQRNALLKLAYQKRNLPMKDLASAIGVTQQSVEAIINDRRKDAKRKP